MRDNPFVKNFEELLEGIVKDNNTHTEIISLYIADESEDSIFEELLVQPLKRIIGGKEIKFLAIRNVKLKEKYKGKNLFTNFIEKLEELDVPIFIHDMINDEFSSFFQKRGYQLHKENKCDHEIVSWFKIAKNAVHIKSIKV